MNNFFLGINFEKHISKISIITEKKRNALPALHPFTNQMSPDKMLLKVFIEFQFSYGPLISIFQWRTIDNKINRLHEKALTIVYSNLKAKFECLEIDGTFSIHDQNIKDLAIEIFRTLNGLIPAHNE